MFQDLQKELKEIEDDLFYLNMIDRWTTEVSDRHTKLFRRKLEIEETLKERGFEA